MADLVRRHGPLRGECHSAKICDDFRVVGHIAGFYLALWATAYNFVLWYGSQGRILLCAMCHGEDLVMH